MNEINNILFNVLDFLENAREHVICNVADILSEFTQGLNKDRKRVAFAWRGCKIQ